MRFGWLAATAAMVLGAGQADAARYFEFEIRATTHYPFTNPLSGVSVPGSQGDRIRLGFDTLDPRGTTIFQPFGQNISFGQTGDSASLRAFSPSGGPFFDLSFSLLDIPTSSELAGVPVTGSYSVLVCPRSCGTRYDGAVDSFLARTSDTAPSMLGYTINSTFTTVPEPAGWAMMIIGFGAIGGALRRRKVSTRVTYAAA